MRGIRFSQAGMQYEPAQSKRATRFPQAGMQCDQSRSMRASIFPQAGMQCDQAQSMRGIRFPQAGMQCDQAQSMRKAESSGGCSYDSVVGKICRTDSYRHPAKSSLFKMFPKKCKTRKAVLRRKAEIGAVFYKEGANCKPHAY